MYRKYLVHEKGRAVLYADLQKALYGTLRASKLFYNKFRQKIEEMDFKVNPYNECVANKTINGSQCTILWFVDDIMVSHKCPKVVTDILKEINDEFGELAPIKITRGKEHEYLGISIEYQGRKVIFSMKKYITEMLKELPDDMNGMAATPAA